MFNFSPLEIVSYILILVIVSLIVIRRFYKIYKWWHNEEDIIK